jgi:TolB-like protein
MKIVSRVFLSTAILAAFSMNMNAQATKTKKIFVAVLDFDARSGIEQGEAASLSDIFSSQLAQSGKFILVERNGIKKILTEQGFQQSEACSSVECIAEVGKILKVEKIFSGTIGKIGKLFTVSIQLINVSSGQIEVSKGRQHEGEIEDLATNVIPELAAEMTKALTGQDVEVDESGRSSSSYSRHEISLGFGGGPEGKWSVFNRPATELRTSQDVHVKPKNVIHVAYHYHVSPYVALGLRFTSFSQKVENYPVYPRVVGQNFQQTLVINLNAVSLQGRFNFFHGRVEPYGTLSLGYAFGNIRGDGNSNGTLSQQNFDGPAIGFGLGSNFLIVKHFGVTLDFRVLGISAGYKDEKQPPTYYFNGDKFDGSYTAAFLILFYQF